MSPPTYTKAAANSIARIWQSAGLMVTMGFQLFSRSRGLQQTWIAAVLIVTLIGGCSLKSRAVDTLADVLGEGELVYLSDEDPELIEQALPFNLKTIETLLQSSPNHRGLLLTATKTFSLYAYGFVEPQAHALEYSDFDASERARRRAAKLYRRAYNYGLRGLAVSVPEIAATLPVDPDSVAAELDEDDVGLAVWTAAALGGAINVSKDDPESTADIAIVGALLERGLELDDGFEDGTIHEFLLSYEAARVGGSKDKAREHYERALSLGPAKQPSIWLSWAETFSVSEQNRSEFVELIDKTLAFDVSAHPETRLLNTLAQRRARRLKDTIDELFLECGT